MISFFVGMVIGGMFALIILCCIMVGGDNNE